MQRLRCEEGGGDRVGELVSEVVDSGRGLYRGQLAFST